MGEKETRNETIQSIDLSAYIGPENLPLFTKDRP
jgi:hypothetical protein